MGKNESGKRFLKIIIIILKIIIKLCIYIYISIV